MKFFDHPFCTILIIFIIFRAYVKAIPNFIIFQEEFSIHYVHRRSGLTALMGKDEAIALRLLKKNREIRE